jgi:hypothetical protein
MQQVRIMIGMERREYYLPPGVDVASIQATISDLVRAGGGFLNLIDAPDHTLSVLVSPGMSMTLEVTHHEAPPVELESDPDPSWLSPLDLI